MAVINKRAQFQDVFKEVWVVTETVDFGNAATGSGTFASEDITVTGVKLGDVVLGVSAEVDTVDTVIGGAVTADDTVTLTVLNNTAGDVNLAETTVRVLIGRLNEQLSFV